MKCLYCYQPLDKDEIDFHSSCCKNIFGTTQPPIIDFDLKQLEELAKQITDNLFGESGISEGVLDFPTGGTVSYKKDGNFITLTITDADGTVTVIKVPVATMVGAAGGG